MEYSILGNSDLKVSKIIFGTWVAGGWLWGGSDEAQVVSAIHAAIDSGVNCIDTAPVYGFGLSEEIVGRAIKGKREKLIIATKFGLNWEQAEGHYHYTTVNPTDDKKLDIFRNSRREKIIHECEQSLRRLGIETIDLYQCHWPDKTTPFEETMETLLLLKKQGKIREIGVSNFTVEMMHTCRKTANVVCDQPKYNLLNRKIELNILPYCRKNKIGLITYSPIEQGLLTGKVTLNRTFPKDDMRAEKDWFSQTNRERVLAALDKIKPIADNHDITLANLCVNWITSQPGISAAITGARTVEQALENSKAASFKLSEDELKKIEKTFAKLKNPV